MFSDAETENGARQIFWLAATPPPCCVRGRGDGERSHGLKIDYRTTLYDRLGGPTSDGYRERAQRRHSASAQCSDESKEICETFHSQGTAETGLLGAFPRPFRKRPAALPASLKSAQQFGLLRGKLGVGENTTGMELRHALYRSEYLLVRGRSLASRGLLLGRRLMHRFRRFLCSTGAGDDRQMARINVAELARETEGA